MRLTRGRRWLVRTLVALGAVLSVASIFAVWANRQLLDTDNWVATSKPLLADEEIQKALAGFLVGQLYSRVDVRGQIAAALPERVRGLAGPLAAELRQVAERAARRLLDSRQAQGLWEQANRRAHRAFLKILDSPTDEGAVTIDLRALLRALVERLGLSAQLERISGIPLRVGVTLPPDAGRLVIVAPKKLVVTRQAADAIGKLAVVLPLLALAAFAAATALARGRRRRTVGAVALCLVGAGLLVLALREVLGDRLVDSLIARESVAPAGHHAWRISTSMLAEIATAVSVFGALALLATLLAGIAIGRRRSAGGTIRPQTG
jgi:hypothetical protein